LGHSNSRETVEIERLRGALQLILDTPPRLPTADGGWRARSIRTAQEIARSALDDRPMTPDEVVGEMRAIWESRASEYAGDVPVAKAAFAAAEQYHAVNNELRAEVERLRRENEELRTAILDAQDAP
jgi:hypothetical protein